MKNVQRTIFLEEIVLPLVGLLIVLAVFAFGFWMMGGMK